jgi:hypothetical protein
MATYTLINSVTVGSGGAADIEFTSIPATYTDLLVFVSARGSTAGAIENIKVQFNGATTQFTDRTLQGNGASASSDTDTNIRVKMPAATATASTFGNAYFYVPNYAGSTNKSVSVDSVSENNATTASALLNAGLWSNTAAITSVKIAADSGNLVEYTTAYLYGISNA